MPVKLRRHPRAVPPNLPKLKIGMSFVFILKVTGYAAPSSRRSPAGEIIPIRKECEPIRGCASPSNARERNNCASCAQRFHDSL